MADEELKTVIIDNGSGMVKAGFAGEDAPRAVFPAIVGRPKNASAMQGASHKSFYVGDEATKKRGVLNLSYPISHGVVSDWEDMEKIWNHTFYNELHVAPEESAGILVTEAPLQPKQNRERMAEILFGTFNAPNVYVAIQAVMSLYSAGRTTGLVVDSGDGVTHTVPVFEGFSIPHAIHRIDIAGRVLTDYMRKLLQEAGENFTSSSELEIVKDIKEKLCYVALDWEANYNTADTSSANDASYTLPDKRVITVPGTVRMKCPELLFQPTLNGKECLSMHALTWKSTQDSDIDVRKTLLKNVILSGGSTMYENLPDRLKQELLNLAPSGAEVRIVASADRKFAVWKGASTLASLSSFNASWVSKEEFEEHGGAILHRKCA